MRIFLKKSWKFKNIGQSKIYLFNLKNRKLIKKIFDKIYKKNKFK